MKKYKLYCREGKRKLRTIGNLEWKMNPKKRKAIYNKMYRVAKWFAQCMTDETGVNIEPETILKESGYKK